MTLDLMPMFMTSNPIAKSTVSFQHPSRTIFGAYIPTIEIKAIMRDHLSEFNRVESEERSEKVSLVHSFLAYFLHGKWWMTWKLSASCMLLNKILVSYLLLYFTPHNLLLCLFLPYPHQISPRVLHEVQRKKSADAEWR